VSNPSPLSPTIGLSPPDPESCLVAILEPGSEANELDDRAGTRAVTYDDETLFQVLSVGDHRLEMIRPGSELLELRPAAVDKTKIYAHLAPRGWEMRVSAQETLAIGAGLGLLGIAAGAICGMTITSGAAQTLLTGLFTFVGGTILSFSAFAVRRSRSEKTDPPATTAPPNVVRIGAGLGALSIGLIIGAVMGLWFRYRDPLSLTPTVSGALSQANSPVAPVAPAPVAPALVAPAPVVARGVGLQLTPEEDQTLERVRSRLVDKYYKADARGDVAALKEIVDRINKCIVEK
jgi:hypothetical protein